MSIRFPTSSAINGWRYEPTSAVIHAADGNIPSDMATGSAAEIEEERRLLYVAMTRARDHLTLLLPQRFHVHRQAGMGDRHVSASRSRFLTRGVNHYQQVIEGLLERNIGIEKYFSYIVIKSPFVKTHCPIEKLFPERAA